MQPEALVQALAAQAAIEEKCALTAISALRQAEALLSRRLEGAAADAASEVLATVAAQYAKRSATIRPLAASLEAMAAGGAERRAQALSGLLAASAQPGGNGAGAPPAKPPEAPSQAGEAESAGAAPAPAE